MQRQMPTLITAGDSLSLTITTDFSAADGFTIDVNFTGPAGTATTYNYSTTTVDDHTFLLKVLPAVTATYEEGHYVYALVATDQTDEYTIESGTLEVLLRSDLIGSGDFRTHARKVLDAIEAVIEGRATHDQENQTLGDRTIGRTPINDLLRLQKYYENKVAAEAGSSRNKVRLTMRAN